MSRKKTAGRSRPSLSVFPRFRAYLLELHSPLRWRNGCRLLQAKLKHCLARHFDLLAAREHLNGSSCSGTDARADGRAFAAPGDCADNRADSRAATNFLSGVLAAPLALQGLIAADDRIVLPINHHARQLELQLRAAGQMPGFFAFGEPAINIGSFPCDNGIAAGQIAL